MDPNEWIMSIDMEMMIVGKFFWVFCGKVLMSTSTPFWVHCANSSPFLTKLPEIVWTGFKSIHLLHPVFPAWSVLELTCKWIPSKILRTWHSLKCFLWFYLDVKETVDFSLHSSMISYDFFSENISFRLKSCWLLMGYFGWLFFEQAWDKVEWGNQQYFRW